MIQTKTAFEFFESEHLLLTLNCDPYAIGKDHIFERLNPLKKKTVTQVFVDSYLIAAKKKKKQKQMQKLKSNKKYCMEFSFQTELVPFSESKILRQVVCAVQFEIQSELCRNSTLICRAIKYNHWTYRYFVFTVREVCLCWPVVKTRAKKKITISKKNTLKESLQEDCCGNRFCVKECHSCTLRERKTSVSFRSFRLIGGTKTLKSIKFVYWL